MVSNNESTIPAWDGKLATIFTSVVPSFWSPWIDHNPHHQHSCSSCCHCRRRLFPGTLKLACDELQSSTLSINSRSGLFWCCSWQPWTQAGIYRSVNQGVHSTGTNWWRDYGQSCFSSRPLLQGAHRESSIIINRGGFKSYDPQAFITTQNRVEARGSHPDMVWCDVQSILIVFCSYGLFRTLNAWQRGNANTVHGTDPECMLALSHVQSQLWRSLR